MPPVTLIQVAGAQDLIRAAIDPTSIDVESRQFDVVWSTGSRAPMVAHVEGEGWCEFDEELSLDPAHWDFARVEAGTCPLLNDHAGYYGPPQGLHGQIGRVLSVTMTRKEARARVQFSFNPEHEGLWVDVSKGIIRGVSPRYRVSKYEDITKPKDKRRTMRAVKQELRELSLTSIPADPGGRVRAADRNNPYTAELELVGKENNMDPELDPQTPAAPEQARGAVTPAPQAPVVTPAAPARTPAATSPAPAANPSPDLDRVRAEERTRVATINDTARALRLDDAEGLRLAQRLIDAGSNLDQARSDLIFERARRDSATIGPAISRVGVQERDTVRAGMENALAHRLGRRGDDGNPVALTDVGREFRGRSLLRLAEDSLQQAGVQVRGMSPIEIAGAALGLDRVRGGMHSTSDFPDILSNLANQSLRAGYAGHASNWRLLSRRVTANDFKPMQKLQLGEAPQLEKVNEHGEFKRGTIAQSKESYAVETFGKVFAITRKAIVNDATDAFDRLPGMFGRQAAELEASKAIGLLLANPVMGDGNALISGAHANTTTGVISLTSLQAALLLLTKQVGLDGKTLVGNMPKYLIVPAALEIVARQFVTQITPAQASNVNPFVGMFERIIVEPRLDIGVDGQTADAVKWWMTGDPAMVDMLEHAYLAGNEGVFLEQHVGFAVDGIELKARHDFGIAVLDWRGFVRSTGA